MNTILLLGGYGATGKPLTKHLLAQTDYRIAIAGRHLDKAQSFVDSIQNDRVTALQVDATNPASLRQALQGVDLLLVAAPTTHHTPTVVRAALDAGVDYLDVQYSDLKLETLRAVEKEILERKLCFVTEAGYHPGLPSAMIRYAASKLDCIESARTAGYLNMGNLQYTEAVDELMEGFVHYQAQVYRNGAWTKPGSWDMRKFDFGAGIGTKTCYSMFFEELGCIPEMYPTLKDTGFYIAGWNPLTDLLLTPIIMLGLKIAPRRGIRPLGKLMWWGVNRSKPPYRVVLKVEAAGQLNGRPVQVQARIEHEDGYELTAIPVVALLMQYEQIRRPGLHMMGHLVEPDRLFEDMQRMGVQVTTSIQQVFSSPEGDRKMSGTQIGQITHYYDHINVAAIVLTEPLRVGDTIHILGHTTDFKQEVTSIQIEHQQVEEAKPGDDVGIKVIQKVHPHDKVFKLTDE